MKLCKHLLPGAMGFLVLTVLSCSALGAHASKILLTNGSAYEDVEFSIDKQYKILVVEVEGSKKNVSFSDVTAIYDDSGNDVTSSYIGGRGEPGVQQQAIHVEDADLRKQFVEVGSGFAISPDYHDALEDAVGEVSGGYGLLNLEVGFGILTAKRLHIVPKLRMLAGRVQIQYYSGFPASEKVNVVIVPGVAARYELGGNSPSWYATADLGLVYRVRNHVTYCAASGTLRLSHKFRFGHTSQG